MVQDMPRRFQKTQIGACNIYPTRLPKPIEPDASDYQLGSIISQHPSLSHQPIGSSKFFSTIPSGFRPIVFFSRNLSPSQRNYSTLEKELLSSSKRPSNTVPS